MSEPPAEVLLTAAALVCATIGSVHDVRSRRIPNLLTGTSFLVALELRLLFGTWSAVGFSLLAALLAGGITFLFFLSGGMGAGDVKLMAVVGCFVGIKPLGMVLIATALSGAIFAVALALRRRGLRQSLANAFDLIEHHREQGLRPHPEINMQARGSLRMPFAVPIACGCLVALNVQIWRS